MAQTFEVMIENVSRFDKQQIRTLYAALTSKSSSKGCDQSLRKKKVEWLESNHPWLINNKTVKQEKEVSEGVSYDKPYQVQVCEKYLQLYRSAIKRGKDFDLEVKDVHHLLQARVCHYTGVKFEKHGDLKRTIDRIDNRKGYVKGNVVACSHLANQLKEQIFERPTQNKDFNIDFIANVVKTILENNGEEI